MQLPRRILHGVRQGCTAPASSIPSRPSQNLPVCIHDHQRFDGGCSARKFSISLWKSAVTPPAHASTPVWSPLPLGMRDGLALSLSSTGPATLRHTPNATSASGSHVESSAAAARRPTAAAHAPPGGHMRRALRLSPCRATASGPGLGLRIETHSNTPHATRRTHFNATAPFYPPFLPHRLPPRIVIGFLSNMPAAA